MSGRGLCGGCWGRNACSLASGAGAEFSGALHSDNGKVGAPGILSGVCMSPMRRMEVPGGHCLRMCMQCRLALAADGMAGHCAPRRVILSGVHTLTMRVCKCLVCLLGPASAAEPPGGKGHAACDALCASTAAHVKRQCACASTFSLARWQAACAAACNRCTERCSCIARCQPRSCTGTVVRQGAEGRSHAAVWLPPELSIRFACCGGRGVSAK